jgi:two-component system, cell cycle sensor histidine kinase and response regulator CckA
MGGKKDLNDDDKSVSILIHSAEEKLSKSSDTIPELKDKTPEDIIHELQVHQIELETQNEELKRVQLELEQSKDKYQDLYDFAPVGYFTLSDKGMIKEVNLTGASLLRIPRPKLINMRFGHFVAPESEDKWYQHIVDVLKQEVKQTCDVAIKCGDGSLLHARLASMRMDVPSERLGPNFGSHAVRVAVTDITEGMRAEQEVRKFKMIADRANYGCAMTDLDGCLTYVNEAFAAMHGFSSMELIGNNLSVFHSDEQLEHVNQLLKKLLQDDSFDFQEVWHAKLDGSVFPTLMSASVIKDEEGTPLFFSATAIDITDRKRVEEELRISEDKFSKAFHLNPDAILITRLVDGMIVSVNEGFKQIFGDVEEEVIGKSSLELNIWVNHEDRNRVIERLKTYGKINDLEFRFRTKKRGIIQGLMSASIIMLEGVAHVLSITRDITDRKKAEESLKQSEERFSKVFQYGPALITLSNVDDGTYVDVNDKFCEVSGFSRADCIGKTAMDFGWLLPEERNRLFEELHTHGRVRAMDLNTLTKDKRELHLIYNGELIQTQNGPLLLSIAEDISEREQSKEQEKRLMTAIEQAAEAVVITDSTGIILYVNPAEEKISGYSSAELIGQGVNIFKSGKHREDFFTNMWETINAGDRWSGRFVNRKKDGTEYHEDATISPVYDNSGDLTNFVAVKRDVTKQLELQHQLFQAQKMEAMGTLAGGLAHDFNNLLQIILGNLDEILSDTALSKTIQKNLDDIDRAATRGADLVKGMLIYSRKTPFKLQPVNLNKLVEQVRSFLDKTIPKTIDIEFLKDRSLSMTNGDSTQIEQILINLAINARDAMPDGGKITIETRNTLLNHDFCNSYPDIKPGPHVMLSVTDTGIGMGHETIKHIFEPFFTTKEPGKGTGLGLSVVYGIVEKHGGKMICSSAPDLGTTFRIYFPAIEKIPAEQYQTILLVDDEPSFLEITSRVLNRSNYRVILASSGAEALDLYKKHSNEIQLVVLDLMMPGMDGEECLRALLRLDPKVRVLIATGNAETETAEDLKQAGAADLIGKPFDLAQLLDKIHKIIEEDLHGGTCHFPRNVCKESDS